MIIKQYNTFFFHIPKVAGYSIEQFLLPGHRDYKKFDSNIIFGAHNNIMTQHITYTEALEYRSKNFLDSQFKFAFVRNTWERFCSAFFYLEAIYLKKYHSFDNFVEKICDQVHQYKTTSGWHFAKQTDWIFDNNKNICLDFIGSYHNLDTDFKYVCNIIGCEYKPLKKLNSSKFNKLNYRDILNDKNKKIIQYAYHEEIDYFNFKF